MVYLFYYFKHMVQNASEVDQLDFSDAKSTISDLQSGENDLPRCTTPQLPGSYDQVSHVEVKSRAETVISLQKVS